MLISQIVGIIRTMIAEMVPAKLQPKAFSLVPQAWSLGSMVGPAMGGFFAKPADRFPGIFGGVWFFETYPFALPNLIACVFILILVATVTVFLKETLRSEQASDVDDEATPLLTNNKKDRSSKKQLILGLLAYTFLALHTAAYDQVLAVFLDHPVIKHTPENTQLPFKFSGGFGMEPNKIGTLLAICGVCGLIQLIFPPLTSTIGAPACARLCGKSWNYQLPMAISNMNRRIAHHRIYFYSIHRTLRRRPRAPRRPRFLFGLQVILRHHRFPQLTHPPTKKLLLSVSRDPQRLSYRLQRTRSRVWYSHRRRLLLVGRKERLCVGGLVVPCPHGCDRYRADLLDD